MLDLSEFKNVKSSDTRWLAHAKCDTTVKRCNDVIVTALEKNYEESHEPLKPLGSAES